MFPCQSDLPEELSGHYLALHIPDIRAPGPSQTDPLWSKPLPLPNYFAYNNEKLHDSKT